MPRRNDRFRYAVTTAVLGLAALLHPGQVAGQQPEEGGRLTGTVMDAENGEPVSGVQVHLEQIQQGALTNMDGRFLLLDVPSGTHEVTAEMLGYGSKVVTGVEIEPGETTRLDITMESAAVAMDELVVSASRERSSSAYLMDQRRTSGSMVDAVGAMEIGRRPDSDAAEVARRMTGVTVSDGKYVYIRGLGERYSQTRLDGSSLPSPEPDKEVVPLDLFPAGFLESLQMQKSYTPDQAADFSGGSVEIRTKDFPDEFTVRLGMGTSFNTGSQFEAGFLRYPGGGRDFLGIDDGSRGMPAPVRNEVGGLRGERLSSDPDVLVTAGEAFARDLGTFTPSAGATPLNRSLDATIGGTTELFDRDLGFVFAGTYSDAYTIRDRETERKYRVSSFDPEVVGGDGSGAVGNVDYDFQRGTRAVDWGTLGNLSYSLSPGHTVSLRTTVNFSTEDESRRFTGWNREDIGSFIRADRLRFVSRKLFWGQLSGRHELPGDTRLEWRANRARAQRDEPGLREAIYKTDEPEAEEPDFRLANDGESGRYFFSDLVDDEASAGADWSIPFALSGGEGSLKIGGSYRGRDRDFAARRFTWKFLGGVITNFDSAITSAEIVPVVREPGQLSVRENVEPGDRYRVEDERAGGYLMLDVPLTSSLRAVGGARYESYDLGLTSRDRDLATIDRTDWIPSLNLVWSLDDAMKVRGAFSRTLDRPEFRELAPFQFTEATSLRQVFGNPELEPASIRNFDLRWDWFVGPGEVLSAGAFHKRIDDPVEQVFFASAGTAYSFQNGGEATLTGAELDVQLGLNRIGDFLEDFSTSVNLSVVDAEVEVEERGAFIPTNRRRPLEGQASYVFNGGLSWRAPGRDLEVGVFFNRLGDRLTAAGGSGIPDIYEQPRDELDATLHFGLPMGGSVTVKGENLLDTPHRFEQSANGITLIQREYWVGRTLSVGLSWNLD